MQGFRLQGCRLQECRLQACRLQACGLQGAGVRAAGVRAAGPPSHRLLAVRRPAVLVLEERVELDDGLAGQVDGVGDGRVHPNVPVRAGHQVLPARVPLEAVERPALDSVRPLVAYLLLLEQLALLPDEDAAVHGAREQHGSACLLQVRVREAGHPARVLPLRAQQLAGLGLPRLDRRVL